MNASPFRRERLWDGFALLLALVGFLASAQVTFRIFEAIPHIEDEMAYTWEARLIARGFTLTTPTPPCPSCFLVPFVVDAHGQRSSKYPPAWSVVLALGERLGARAWVNPFLAGLSVWLVYRLGKRLLNAPTGALAALFTVISPFFLMNSGSLLNHPWALFLTLAFTHAWLDAFFPSRIPAWLSLPTAGLSMGLLALTRPLTAVGVALPFAVHALIILWRGNPRLRWRLLIFGGIAGAVSLLYFVWQYAVTGDLFLNPYLLWWEYDKIGFGPGVGVREGGHTLAQAWFHTRFSVGVGSHDLMGWPYLSYLFFPFGLIALRRRPQAFLPVGVMLALVAVYNLYWTPAWLYGPRYYYEGLPGAMLLNAAGVCWLTGWITGRGRAVRWGWKNRLGLAGLAFTVMFLCAANVNLYLPIRLSMLVGLYDVRASDLAPFLSPEAQKMPPTLVIVYPQRKWIEYGRLLDLSSPLFDSQFVFILDRGEILNREVMQFFPGRLVWHYTPGVTRLTPVSDDAP